MRGEGSLGSRFVHLDTSYQHRDTEDTGRHTRYRQTRSKIPVVGVERCWPGYGCDCWPGFLSVSESAAPDWELPRAKGEHSGSAIYIQTMYTSHLAPDCSTVQYSMVQYSTVQYNTDNVSITS